MRTVVWFSAGAASAVAAKIAVTERKNVAIAYTDPGSEHEDNKRFMADCEKWFGQEIIRLKSDRYVDTWDVFSKTRYLNGVGGARCTVELKKRVRFTFQQPEDEQVFGYTSDEKACAYRFRENNPDVELWTPLIDKGITHGDTLAIIEDAGIDLPVMYKLGYGHNNCIGCVKGGMGYWNKIRRDFPEHFNRMAKLEREIGASCIKNQYLDELDPQVGRYQDEPSIECSLLCATLSEQLTVTSTISKGVNK